MIYYCCLLFFIEIIRCLSFFATWLEAFADARDGDGGGGGNRDQYLFHPSPSTRTFLVFDDLLMIVLTFGHNNEKHQTHVVFL